MTILNNKNSNKVNEINNTSYTLKRVISLEGFVFLALFIGFFMLLGSKMGFINSINTLLNTAYSLLMETVLYIMAIAVIAGAISNLFTEFGVISIANKILSPLMKPIYGLPGASSIAIFTTYLSDNPAVLTLADDKRFRRYFKKYQLPALTNIGTSFGMGLIVSVFMMSLTSYSGESYVFATVVGNLGAVVGSIVSTRLMLRTTRKIYGTELEAEDEKLGQNYDILKYREIREGSVGERFINAMLEGGASGVKVGIDIIPGVLVICSVVMIFTNGAPESGIYTGGLNEGIALLPILGEKISFLIKPLFGFTSSAAISVPITALGSAGAAISLIPNMLKKGLVGARDVSVFTSMCMCWSGFLSTHVAMMDSLNFRKLTGKAILSHTLGGIVGGISANFIFQILELFI